MALMTQDNMKKLVSGGANIVSNSSLGILEFHLADIAIAALGDDPEALNGVLRSYSNEMRDLVLRTDFLRPEAAQKANEYIDWLRTL